MKRKLIILLGTLVVAILSGCAATKSEDVQPIYTDSKRFERRTCEDLNDRLKDLQNQDAQYSYEQDECRSTNKWTFGVGCSDGRMTRHLGLIRGEKKAIVEVLKRRKCKVYDEVDTVAENKIQPNPDLNPRLNSDVKSDLNPEVKSETKQETKHELKPETNAISSPNGWKIKSVEIVEGKTEKNKDKSADTATEKIESNKLFKEVGTKEVAPKSDVSTCEIFRDRHTGKCEFLNPLIKKVEKIPAKSIQDKPTQEVTENGSDKAPKEKTQNASEVVTKAPEVKVHQEKEMGIKTLEISPTESKSEVTKTVQESSKPAILEAFQAKQRRNEQLKDKSDQKESNTDKKELSTAKETIQEKKEPKTQKTRIQEKAVSQPHRTHAMKRGKPAVKYTLVPYHESNTYDSEKTKKQGQKKTKKPNFLRGSFGRNN